MTNRRQFLQIGIVATVLPLAAPAVDAASLGLASPADTLPLYKGLYDTRFASSIAFAERLARHGIALHGFNGDITRFWYDDLYPIWKSGPAAIAGLTARGALFCLERLAWDQGMRVVFRSEHRFVDGGVHHEITGPLSMLQEATSAMRARSWAACMADAAVQCPTGRAELKSVRHSTPAREPLPDQSLYAWVIAPVVKA